MAQIVQELLQISESSLEIMEVPTESDIPDADQTGESSARFHSVSVQTCPPRSVKSLLEIVAKVRRVMYVQVVLSI